MSGVSRVWHDGGVDPRRSPLSDRVIVVLNRFDPMALLPGRDGEAPHEEYDPEARDYAHLLHINGTISAAEVDDVWQKWFDQPVGSAEVSQALAAELRALVAR